jgi:hypothetical protein
MEQIAVCQPIKRQVCVFHADNHHNLCIIQVDPPSCISVKETIEQHIYDTNRWPLPDDIISAIADYLWFGSDAMKNTCRRWHHLIAGRYTITIHTAFGSQCLIWPPTLGLPLGGPLWLDVSQSPNQLLLIPTLSPPAGELLRWVSSMQHPDYIVIGYTNSEPPHPDALASMMIKWMIHRQSPHIITQAGGRCLVVIATGREARRWVADLHLPIICKPRHLRCYVCIPPVARWVSIENYTRWYDWNSYPIAALAVKVYTASTLDPREAFMMAQAHWRQQNRTFTVMDGMAVGEPTTTALCRLAGAIESMCYNP